MFPIPDQLRITILAHLAEPVGVYTILDVTQLVVIATFSIVGVRAFCLVSSWTAALVAELLIANLLVGKSESYSYTLT